MPTTRRMESMHIRAIFKIKCNTNVGDFVRTFKKEGKSGEMKEHVKGWTEATYKVIGIDQSGLNGQVSDKLDGLAKLHLRNELLYITFFHVDIYHLEICCKMYEQYKKYEQNIIYVGIWRIIYCCILFIVKKY